MTMTNICRVSVYMTAASPPTAIQNMMCVQTESTQRRQTPAAWLNICLTTSNVKRGQNSEAEAEAEAKAMRSRPRPKIIMKKVPNNDLKQHMI